MKPNSPGCTCCGAVNCRCPLGCCDGEPPQTIDQVVSGFPSYVMRDGVYSVPFSLSSMRIKLEISGLDGINGTVPNYFVIAPIDADNCKLVHAGFTWEVTVTISYNDVDPFPHTCSTPLTSTQTVVFTVGSNPGEGGIIWTFGYKSQSGAFTGVANDIMNALPEMINVFLHVPNVLGPLMYNGFLNLCNGGSFTDNYTWMQVTGTTCDQSGPLSGDIVTNYNANYGPPTTIKAKGIKYTISDLPTEFISRIGVSTTVMGVSGLEAFNGTYEVEFDDAYLCTGGVYEETIEVQVQEYNVSTSSPCTSFPVGSPVTGTATLLLAPTNEAFFTWVIRIEHPYLTGVRIDYIQLNSEWPTGIHCDGYSDTWHEGDECASNADPVITIEADPLWV